MLLPRPGDIYVSKLFKHEVQIMDSNDQTITFARTEFGGVVRQTMQTDIFEKEFEFIRSN